MPDNISNAASGSQAAVAVDFLLRWEPKGLWLPTVIDPMTEAIETKPFSAQTADEAATWIAKWNGKRNLYWSPNTVRRAQDSKASKQDISAAMTLHVDIDPKDPPEGTTDFAAWYAAEKVRILADIRAYPHKPTVILFSGGGVQAFWKLDRPYPIDDATQQKDINFIEGRNRKLEFDLTGATKCFDISRIMRLPGTWNVPTKPKIAKGRTEQVMATIEYAEWDLLHDVHDFKEMAQAQPDTATPGASKERTRRDTKDETERMARDGDKAGRFGGDESRAVWKVCMDMARRGRGQDEIVAVLLDKANAVSGHVYRQGNPQKYAHKQAAKAIEIAGRDFKVYAKGQRKGQVIVDQDNLELALAKLEVDLSYDEFNGSDMIAGPGDLPLRHLEDYDESLIYTRIDRDYGLRPADIYLRKYLTVTCREQSYHPVRDYLDSLTWDGTKRIDTWLTDYMGVEDSPYARAIGAIWLMAAVRRVRQPGVKFDEMLVMISVLQGLDKSSALAVLAVKQEWFTNSLPLNADDQKVIEQLRGKWICEAAELKGMKGKSVEHLKAFLSRQVDRARLSYGYRRSEVPRQCVYAGSTNSTAFLRDTTGNRRIWPVTVARVDVTALHRDRDQLWAEAAAREAQGESIRLPKELYEAAAMEQQQREIDEPWAEALTRALHPYKAHRILPGDAFTLVKKEVQHRDQDASEKLGEAMRKIGWERRKLYDSTIKDLAWFYCTGWAKGQGGKLATLHVHKDIDTGAVQVTVGVADPDEPTGDLTDP